MARQLLSAEEKQYIDYKIQSLGGRLTDIEQAGYLLRYDWGPLALDTLPGMPAAPVAPFAVKDSLAATTLLATAQPGYTTGIVQPDYARAVDVILALGGGSQLAAGAVVNVYGTDYWGNPLTEAISVAAIGSSTVHGVHAFKTITAYDLPVRANSGDTIEVSITAKLGLGRLVFRNHVLNFCTDTATDTYTLTIHATDPSRSLLLPNTAPNGTHVYRLLAIDERY